MRLNSVVFPAPLGPITPTISHSPADRLTSRLAWTPPKAMEQSRASSTDVTHPDLGLLGAVEAEPATLQPALHRPDLLADTARVGGEREEQEHGSDDDWRQLTGKVGQAGDLVDQAVEVDLAEDQVVDDGEEGRADDHPGAAAQPADHGHEHEDQSELE